MSGVFEKTGDDAPDGTEAATLVQRFWLSFIRSIAEPHLAEDGGSEMRELLDGSLAENVDKAVAAALQGLPPHRCGSFGRAALSVMRSREKRGGEPIRLPDGGASPGGPL